MKQDHHTIIIQWNEAGQNYLAYAPDLPEYVAHGYTQQEALRSLLGVLSIVNKTIEKLEKLESIPSSEWKRATDDD